MKIYIVTGNWFNIENKDYDYWIVKSFIDKDKAIELVGELNDFVFSMNLYDEGLKYDEHLKADYLRNKGEVEYMYEECELEGDVGPCTAY